MCSSFRIIISLTGIFHQRDQLQHERMRSLLAVYKASRWIIYYFKIALVNYSKQSGGLMSHEGDGKVFQSEFMTSERRGHSLGISSSSISMNLHKLTSSGIDQINKVNGAPPGWAEGKKTVRNSGFLKNRNQMDEGVREHQQVQRKRLISADLWRPVSAVSCSMTSQHHQETTKCTE